MFTNLNDLNFIHKNSLSDVILSDKCTLQEIVVSLNNTGMKIILIVDKHGKYVGTITDGDIRKGLLNGLDINGLANKIINRNSIFHLSNETKEVIGKTITEKKVFHIPILNKDKTINGLYVLDQFMSKIKSNKIIIMAGGKGERLMPYTKDCPKPMLRVMGKPILEIIIERAKKQGFTDFIISVNYLGQIIKEYFGDGSKWEVSINYVNETKPLGTAGSLGFLKSKLKEPFFVINGDIITDVPFEDILDFHNYNKAVATMSVNNYEMQNPYGVVFTKGIHITGFEEKPKYLSYVNSGIYLLNPEALKYTKRNVFLNMPELFNLLRKSNNKTIVFPVHETLLDIGQRSEYELVNK